MDFLKKYKERMCEIDDTSFVSFVLEVFEYQFNHCEIYQKYCSQLGQTPQKVNNLSEIPFLPIEFFKKHTIKSGEWKAEKIYKSSGTTSQNRSKHFIKSVSLYHENTKYIFERFFGQISDYQIFALLPSYQEQGDSSLISMVDYFMKFSKDGSGYFLERNLPKKIDSENTLLIGVSYALLDCNRIEITSKKCIVMETGGMKGRKREITRFELHDLLKEKFNQNEIWSEYGMTELLSQAYGKNGVFCFPKWAKVLVREIDDPFSYVENDKSGGLNIIDLANIHSCCFIETKDLGKKTSEDTFEVIGRFDNSDIRGCNLLI